MKLFSGVSDWWVMRQFNRKECWQMGFICAMQSAQQLREEPLLTEEQVEVVKLAAGKAYDAAVQVVRNLP